MCDKPLTLRDFSQLREHEEYGDFITLSHYLQQSPSNTVQYLYTAPDGSLWRLTFMQQ